MNTRMIFGCSDMENIVIEIILKKGYFAGFCCMLKFLSSLSATLLYLHISNHNISKVMMKDVYVLGIFNKMEN